MYDELDELATALHDAVLPANLPVLPRLDVAARFAVSADAGESTGAWFDVVVLDSGKVGLVIGQVPGSGIEVVAATAAIAAVVRTGLLLHEDVAGAVELADLYARRSQDARGTTATVALLDLDGGELSYATAGHEAPLLSSSGGTHRLDRTGHRPLGWTGAADVARHAISDGTGVALSSMLDVPEGSGPAPTTAVVLDRAPTGADAATRCAALADHLAATQGRGAAVAVVAVVHPGSADDLSLDCPVDADTARSVRHSLDEWLARLGATPADASFLTHAAAELVTNVRVHAYRDGDANQEVGVRASHLPSGEVVVDVVDHGKWRTTPDDVAMGRGLAMASGLVDHLDVETGEGGTRVRLRHRLVRPVAVDRGLGSAEPTVSEAVEITTTAPGVVRLAGALGHDEVEQLASALSIASRGGTRELEIDLTDVTDVSAGGLRMLADLVGADSEGPGTVSLHVRAGSDPHHKLERAGIGHRAV